MQRDGDRIGIMGRSGSGKTVLALGLVENTKRLFVVDPKGGADWRGAGCEVITHMAQIPAFLKEMGDGAFRAVYVPAATRRKEEMSDIALMLLDWNVGHNDNKLTRNITLVCDEMADTFPNYQMPHLPGMPELCQKGRSYGITLIGIAQRPAKVNTDFRSNCNFMCAFKFGFPDDKKAIAEAMEDMNVMNMIDQLAPYHYVSYSEKEGVKVKSPAKFG